MFRICRTTESHKSTFDSSISWEAFGGDASLLCRMQGPALGPFLEIRILNVSEKERIPRQHVRFLVRQKGSPPFQAGDAREYAMVRHEIHLLIHPDVVIDVRLFI